MKVDMVDDMEVHKMMNEVTNALCAFFFREVSIGKFPKMSTSPFIFTFTF